MSNLATTSNSEASSDHLSSSPPRKRRRVMGQNNPFVDLEAGEEAEEEGEEETDETEDEDDTDIEDDVLEQDSEDPIGQMRTNRHEATLQTVISRIERRAQLHNSEARQRRSPPRSPEIPAALVNALCMPALTDPPMWRVRIKERDYEKDYTFNVLHRHLMLRPQLAISLLSSRFCRGWIAVESRSLESVRELCLNVSTIPQPPQIECVPLEERVSWLHGDANARDTPPLCPAWARLLSKGVLRQKHDLDPNLTKYGGDLVFMVGANSYPYVNFMVVPRLPVQQLPPCKKKFKRLPRLLTEQCDIINNPEMEKLFSRDIYWFPHKPYSVQWVGETNCYKIRGFRVQETFWDTFAIFQHVHINALALENIRPTLGELNHFSWGFSSQQDPYIKPFLKRSYERFFGAPLDIGHRVSVVPLKLAKTADNTLAPVVSKQEAPRGIVVDVSFDTAFVEDEITGTIQEFPAQELRRIFISGDTVRVHAEVSVHHRDAEGWVIRADEEDVTVFDSHSKTEVTVKPWQLVPKELDFTLAVNSSRPEQQKSFLALRGYDRYNELVNMRVVIGGFHPDKGFRGRIRQHVANQIMRVELESGMRHVDVHVNQLLRIEAFSRRLRDYYVEGHRYYAVPPVDYATSEMLRAAPPVPLTLALPRFPTPQPEIVEEGDNPWNPNYNPEVESSAEEGVPPTPAIDLQSVHFPPPLVFHDRVLAHDWLFHSALANKRIFVQVTNTRPTASSPGYEHGLLEGERGMITSAEREPEVVTVHMQTAKRNLSIPLRFLSPVAPSGKRQPVVVLEGDRRGEVLLTREPNSEGLFPLVPRHQSRGKAGPVCELRASQLARCDPK